MTDRKHTRRPTLDLPPVVAAAEAKVESLRKIPQHLLTREDKILLSRDGYAPSPLSSFPRKQREEIAREVALPYPPEKWSFGSSWQGVRRAWWEWHWQRDEFPGLTRRLRREEASRSLRRKVIERDGLLCGLCAGEVDPDDVHVDHIFPVRHGGRTVLKNLQVTHSVCNLKKGASVG